MTKAELIEDLRGEYKQWTDLLDQIGEERMDMPGLTEQWSVKDVVAHLTGWRWRTVDRFAAARRGEGEPSMRWPSNLKTDDEINAWIYDQNHSRPVKDVLVDSQVVFEALVAALEDLPEADLLEPQRFAWLEGEALTAKALFGHFHEEHEPDMRAWLAREQNRNQS
jgi:hypothetical protein